ncbi:VWA domain-containing protein [Allobranchiibius sp. GilTou38]|uniref:VWA domain-containing protein n=1 Tax=Allobranchiibius sp. GilTou38 TaxID=2815210 RepID=UPI003260B182
MDSVPQFPFSAIVGADEMAIALVLTTVAPDVGGVLVRGEKGTAKSTMVRSLAAVLPEQDVVDGCRFGCDPSEPDPQCPDGPHTPGEDAVQRPARLVELPIGASDDRVTGSLDLSRALGSGQTAFEPGLLADAHRGLLYVDEVNLLQDHLVDLLLDAAAMGRNTVERDGVSVTHAARIMLIGTMNPEEGELRPQLLDRFGLSVEITASRVPQERVEIVRRRLAYDADPEGFATTYADAQATLGARLAAAQQRLADVELSDWALGKIATVCAGFDVDGMRADIVTARAARAHAAWQDRDSVAREDIRVAAKLALPHRRRRKPFDAPGLDEDLLDRLLGDDDEPDPTPDDTNDDPDPQQPQPDSQNDGEETDREDSPSGGDSSSSDSGDSGQDAAPPTPHQDGGQADRSDQEQELDTAAPEAPSAALQVAQAEEPYRVRSFTVRGVGRGEAGRRSRAITNWGATIGSERDGTGAVHLPATIRAAALRGAGRAGAGRLHVAGEDLRHKVTQGRESNLVLIAVDASGSMGARERMREVKTAVISLLTDAYQRRDRVGVVTFRGAEADLALPPTHSVEAAAACLTDLPHGGRTPLAEGLLAAARALEVERIRDPHRRVLLVLVTDGRATSGPDALERARWVADRWPSTGVDAVVVDAETGRFRMGLAADLAERMGAEHVTLAEFAADSLVSAIRERSVA